MKYPQKSLTEDAQKEHDWLLDQFSRFPFMIYKFLLILTMIIVLSIQPDLISCQFQGLADGLRIGLAMASVSSILVLLGCGEMFFSMVKRKSTLAQKGLIKFQFSIFGGFCAFGLNGKLHLDSKMFFLFETFLMVAFPLTIVINLIGGFAVLRTFKKNHPLTRSQDLQDMNLLTADFLEQNEVIESEILKYDKQLDRCSYKIYRFWLRFVIMLEIMIISATVLRWRQITRGMGFIIILWSLHAFCCYKMEVVFRTKLLEKSKTALFYLKLCIFASTIPSAITIILLEEIVTIGYVLSTVGFFSIPPLISLVGAFHVNKVLEHRDQFVKVSSYSGDHYL